MGNTFDASTATTDEFVLDYLKKLGQVAAGTVAMTAAFKPWQSWVEPIVNSEDRLQIKTDSQRQRTLLKKMEQAGHVVKSPTGYKMTQQGMQSLKSLDEIMTTQLDLSHTRRKSIPEMRNTSYSSPKSKAPSIPAPTTKPASFRTPFKHRIKFNGGVASIATTALEVMGASGLLGSQVQQSYQHYAQMEDDAYNAGMEMLGLRSPQASTTQVAPVEQPQTTVDPYAPLTAEELSSAPPAPELPPPPSAAPQVEPIRQQQAMIVEPDTQPIAQQPAQQITPPAYDPALDPRNADYIAARNALGDNPTAQQVKEVERLGLKIHKSIYG